MVFLSLMLVAGLSACSVRPDPNGIRRVTISNVRYVAFTVTWITDAATNGTVTWGTSKPPGNVVPDTVSSTTTHSVTISGLSPDTTYYFQVGSGPDMDNNHGAYYQVTTGPVLFTLPGSTIHGKVYQSNGTTVVPNAIVYLQVQDANGSGSPASSQLASTRADSSGVWSYNLGNLRTSDFQAYFSFNPGDNLRLIGEGGNQGTSGRDPSPFIIPIPSGNPIQQDIILNQSSSASLSRP